MSTAHHHDDQDDRCNNGQEYGTENAGGRVLDFPNPAAMNTLTGSAMNGAVNGAGDRPVNVPDTGLVNTSGELVGPVLEGEIVEDGDGPEDAVAGVLVDSPDARSWGIWTGCGPPSGCRWSRTGPRPGTGW